MCITCAWAPSAPCATDRLWVDSGECRGRYCRWFGGHESTARSREEIAWIAGGRVALWISSMVWATSHAATVQESKRPHRRKIKAPSRLLAPLLDNQWSCRTWSLVTPLVGPPLEGRAADPRRKLLPSQGASGAPSHSRGRRSVAPSTEPA